LEDELARTEGAPRFRGQKGYIRNLKRRIRELRAAVRGKPAATKPKLRGEAWKLARASKRGDLISFIRALGGIAYDPHHAGELYETFGEKRQPKQVGMGPLVHGPKSQGGIHWEQVIELATDAGFFPPGFDSSNMDVSDLVAMLKRNVLRATPFERSIDAQLEQREADLLEQEQEERAAEGEAQAEATTTAAAPAAPSPGKPGGTKLEAEAKAGGFEDFTALLEGLPPPEDIPEYIDKPEGAKEELGRGSAAVTWRIEFEGQPAVAKVNLPPDKAISAETPQQRHDSEKLALEALAAAGIGPAEGVPTLLGEMVTEGGSPVLVYTFMPGEPVHAYAQSQNLPLGFWKRTRDLFARIVDAGIVHTDLNTDNILVGPEGNPALIDWEGARHRGNLPVAKWNEEVAKSSGRLDANAQAFAEEKGKRHGTTKPDIGETGGGLRVEVRAVVPTGRPVQEAADVPLPRQPTDQPQVLPARERDAPGRRGVLGPVGGGVSEGAPGGLPGVSEGPPGAVKPPPAALPAELQAVFDSAEIKKILRGVLKGQSRIRGSDVAQELWIRVFERQGQWDPKKGKPAAWIQRIARNLVEDERRAESKEVLAQEVVETVAQVGSVPDAAIEAIEPTLREAIEDLTDQERLALVVQGGFRKAPPSRLVDLVLGTRPNRGKSRERALEALRNGYRKHKVAGEAKRYLTAPEFARVLGLEARALPGFLSKLAAKKLAIDNAMDGDMGQRHDPGHVMIEPEDCP